MEITQTGITYTVSKDFGDYSISGKIEEYINSDKFYAEFKLKESNKIRLELYYIPKNDSGRTTINYFFEDINEMQQYLTILFNFVIDAINNISNTQIV